MVEKPETSLGNRTHRELGVRRHTELAHHEYVERGPKVTCHDCRYRDTSARQPKDNDVSTLQIVQSFTEERTRIITIPKDSHVHPLADVTTGLGSKEPEA